MKQNTLLILLVLSASGIQKSYAQANTRLSNLVAPTAINRALLPNASNIINLGSATLPYRYAYLNRLVFPDASFQTTASRWQNNGSSVYYNSGNIGIGTNTPTRKLQVAGGDALINNLTIGLGGGNSPLNTAIGYQALINNAVGGLSNGLRNTAIGCQALALNKIGWDNTAVGYMCLTSNTEGLYNTGIGRSALMANTTGQFNTANGASTLSSLNTGWYNTATGSGALANCIDGYCNTANGVLALEHTQGTGGFNTAMGYYSLNSNVLGEGNTALGSLALTINENGLFNTALGSGADVSDPNFNNATAVGSGAIVNDSNKVMLGNAAVTIVESAGNFVTSDGRFKFNVKEEVKGLEFINLLRPVTYNFDSKKFQEFLMQKMSKEETNKRMKAMYASLEKATLVTQTGFIAQEVEAAAKQVNYNFNAVHIPQNVTDNYSISYEKIVVPLVKAVQELSAENEILKSRLEKLEEKFNPTATVNLNSATLEQNIPNPASQMTTIKYFIPKGNGYASIDISGATGKIKTIPVSSNGKGQLQLQTSGLVAGAYNYSLIIDGTIMDTKQMILIR